MRISTNHFGYISAFQRYHWQSAWRGENFSAVWPVPEEITHALKRGEITVETEPLCGRVEI